MCRKLVELDATYQVARHISSASNRRMMLELDAELCSNAQHNGDSTSDSASNMHPAPLATAVISNNTTQYFDIDMTQHQSAQTDLNVPPLFDIIPMWPQRLGAQVTVSNADQARLSEVVRDNGYGASGAAGPRHRSPLRDIGSNASTPLRCVGGRGQLPPPAFEGEFLESQLFATARSFFPRFPRRVRSPATAQHTKMIDGVMCVRGTKYSTCATS